MSVWYGASQSSEVAFTVEAKPQEKDRGSTVLNR